jgi:hypothetical protein
VGPINIANGTNLTPEDIKIIFDTQALHPSFDDIAPWYRDPDIAAYDYYIVESQIGLYESSGVFEEGQFTAGDLLITHEIYEELATLRQQAEEALASAKPKLESLKAAGKDVSTLEMLVEKAEELMVAYDYLDAKIFAQAAVEWVAYLEG